MEAAGREQTVKRLADRVRGTGIPRQERYSLQANGGAIKSSVMKDAVRSAGRDPDDPGEADQYWFEDEDIVVIDLQPHE